MLLASIALPSMVSLGMSCQWATRLLHLWYLVSQKARSSKALPMGTPSDMMYWPSGHHWMPDGKESGGVVWRSRPRRNPSVLVTLTLVLRDFFHIPFSHVE